MARLQTVVTENRRLEKMEWENAKDVALRNKVASELKVIAPSLSAGKNRMAATETGTKPSTRKSREMSAGGGEAEEGNDKANAPTDVNTTETEKSKGARGKSLHQR